MVFRIEPRVWHMPQRAWLQQLNVFVVCIYMYALTTSVSPVQKEVRTLSLDEGV